MAKHAQTFFLFFAIQMLQYFAVTVNMRAVAKGDYVFTIISDLVIAAIGFKLIKKVSEATSTYAWIGYAMGGALGSVFAIYVTKVIYGN